MHTEKHCTGLSDIFISTRFLFSLKILGGHLVIWVFQKVYLIIWGSDISTQVPKVKEFPCPWNPFIRAGKHWKLEAIKVLYSLIVNKGLYTDHHRHGLFQVAVSNQFSPKSLKI